MCVDGYNGYWAIVIVLGLLLKYMFAWISFGTGYCFDWSMLLLPILFLLIFATMSLKCAPSV